MVKITDQEKSIILDICKTYLPKSTIYAFGSRTKKKCKPYSDLDLAIEDDTEISLKQKGQLIDALQNSDLPYRVDIIDLATVDDSFKKVIAQDFLQI